MKNIILSIVLTAIFTSCNTTSDRTKQLEILVADQKKISDEYQLHLNRKIDRIRAYGDNPDKHVLDSLDGVDSVYEKQLADIQRKIDSVSALPSK